MNDKNENYFSRRLNIQVFELLCDGSTDGIKRCFENMCSWNSKTQKIVT